MRQAVLQPSAGCESRARGVRVATLIRVVGSHPTYPWSQSYIPGTRLEDSQRVSGALLATCAQPVDSFRPPLMELSK